MENRPKIPIRDYRELNSRIYKSWGNVAIKLTVLSILSQAMLQPSVSQKAFAEEIKPQEYAAKKALWKKKMASIEFSLDEPERPRSDFWAPFGSFLLPGLDQWMEGQTDQAIIYTGGFLFATNLESRYLRSHSQEQALKELTKATPSDPYVKNRTLRRLGLASQSARTFGALSAYQSFRSAVNTRKQLGEYLFLEHHEPVSEIALAPFNFSYLKRSSSYIPLGMAAALAGLSWSQTPKQLEKQDLKRSFTAEDGGFAAATSYNAGVWEEAVFRGWLLPYAYQQFGNQTLANISVASLFALGHISSENRLPYPQLAIGYYLGSLTMDSEWSISESIFIHTWWDVLIIASQYSLERTSSETKPVFRLPPFNIFF